MESAQIIANRLIATHKSGVEDPFIEDGHLSEDFVLFTPEKEKSIIDIILENFEGAFGWIKNI